MTFAVQEILTSSFFVQRFFEKIEVVTRVSRIVSVDFPCCVSVVTLAANDFFS